MSEQILLQPIVAANTDKAKESLEKARIAHEMLIRSVNARGLLQACNFNVGTRSN